MECLIDNLLDDMFGNIDDLLDNSNDELWHNH